MKDSHDSAKLRTEPLQRVTGLASRALAELAARRGSRRSLMSERLAEEFVAAALAVDEGRLRSALETMLNAGVPEHEIVDLYIPETARRLGDAWCDDGLGFAEVTIATAWLQRFVRELTPAPREALAAGEAETSFLIVVRASENHTLGAMIAASQLRRAGASVRLILDSPDHVVLRAVSEGQYSAILISAGCREKIADFRNFVTELRKAAPQPSLIGLGGAVGQFGEDARQMSGVDFVSTDAREIIRLCGLKISTRGATRRGSSV